MNGNKRNTGVLLIALLSVSVGANAQQTTTKLKPLSQIDRFNYIVGTEVIGGFHQTKPFDGPPLVDGAQKVLDMGSPILKLVVSPRYAQNGYADKADPSIKSLTQLAQVDYYKQVFAMPFSQYIMWTYAFSTDGQLWPWHGHMKQETIDAEYKEMYEFTKYLLTTYNDTGKTFYLGNWEGDWHLIDGSPTAQYKWLRDPNPDAAPGMIDWLKARQRAIDDAKRDTPHKDVQVYFYVETNLVQKTIKEGKVTVTSAVLHDVNPDFVSYSSYDSTNPDKDMHHDLPTALDFMQSKLTPKPGLPEKRVFIGEYSSLARVFDPQKQDAFMRDIIATSIKWGTPLVLYWGLYTNSVKDKCWLIDMDGVKQPVYYTYVHFDADARAYVASYLKKHKHVPSDAEFQAFAYQWFTVPAKS
jgi:hypothetical protein